MVARKGVALVLAVVGLAVAAPSAGATFHLMGIREVLAGGATPTSEFVELQMYAPLQNFVGGHKLTLYSSTASLTGTCTFSGDVPNGANQDTILFATPAAVAEFGKAADCSLTDADRLSPTGGAACWETLDCVSWGSFSGSLPSPAGTPAPAMTPGMSLTRSIAAGCSTLFEARDDTNNSAADFALTSPTPRNNADPVDGMPCTGDGGGGGSDTTPPQTTITKAPDKKITKAKVKIKFSSDEAESSFMCKLDKRGFKPCESPYKARVKAGKHTFKVFAVDPSGNADSSPAKVKFKRVAD